MKKLIHKALALIILLFSTSIWAEMLNNAHMQELKIAAQHFGYVCHELITYEHDSAQADALRSAITSVKVGYKNALEKLTVQLQAADHSDALEKFGNYIFNLAQTLGVHNAVEISLMSPMNIVDQSALIIKTMLSIEKHFSRLNPGKKILHHITDYLFYNYLTTKVVPNVIHYSAPFLSGIWAINICKLYNLNFNHQTGENSIGTYRAKCKLPTVNDAQKNAVKTERELCKRMVEILNQYECEYAKEYYVNQRADIDIHRVYDDIKQHILQEDEKKELRKLAGSVSEAQETYQKSRSHKCHYINNRPNHTNRNDRGEDIYGGIHFDASTQENLYNMALLGKDIAWSLRPVYLYYSMRKFAEKIHALQIEKYTKRCQQALDKMPVDKALKKIGIIDPASSGIFAQLFNKPFDNYASKEQLDRYGLSVQITNMQDPLVHNAHMVVCSDNDACIEKVVRGIIKETNIPAIRLSPLVASNKAHVHATIERAMQIADARPDKTVIIHLEDIDYLADGSRALDHIKTLVFDPARNPFIKLMVIATAADAQKIPAQLIGNGYLPAPQILA